MTTSTAARPAVSDDRPGLIHARPVRHPGRWVAIAVIAVLALMFLNMVIFNPAFNWPLVFQAIPRYVLLTIMGALGVLFTAGLSIGVPFDWKIIDWLGLSGSWRFATFDAN